MTPLPCPFCGTTGLDFSDGSTFRWGIASCISCGATCGETRREYPDKGEWHSDAVEEWNRRVQAPSLTVGEYTLTNYPGGDYWLQHEDGEGMQVRKERMETLIKELWKEF